MKRIILSLVAIATITLSSFGQAPEGFKYQAVVRDAGNTILNNQAVGMRMTIQQGSIGGTTVYQETFSPTTNAYGLVNLEIGSGTVVSGNFTTIDWSAGPYFIETAVDVTGGTSYAVMGTSQLMSVPYALHAKTAESIVGGGSGGGGFTHYIGEEFGGGVIFHLWKDAQGVEHGLIVDKTDLSTTGQVWSNIDATLIGASAQSIWDGLSNSNAIVGQAGHTSSASALCLNSTNGAQSDWYLPSVQELNMLWNNYYTVARSLTQISGATQLQPADYWSSTEYGFSTASLFDFYVGHAQYGYKSNSILVRAVRAF